MESKKSWIFCGTPGGALGADDIVTGGAEMREVEAAGLGASVFGAVAAGAAYKLWPRRFHRTAKPRNFSRIDVLTIRARRPVRFAFDNTQTSLVFSSVVLKVRVVQVLL